MVGTDGGVWMLDRGGNVVANVCEKNGIKTDASQPVEQTVLEVVQVAAKQMLHIWHS